MKRILFLITLFWITPTYAEIFEMNNCHGKEGNSWNQELWQNYSTTKISEFDPITFEKKKGSEKLINRLEDKILSIDTNIQKIFVTTIRTNEYLEYSKLLAKWYENSEEGQKEKRKIIENDPLGKDFGEQIYKSLVQGYKNKHKISQKEYDLVTITSGIVTGKGDLYGLDAKIFVDLNKGKFNYALKNIDGSNLQQGSSLICNVELASSGNETSGSSGTAFFISNKGHLLTNNHVVEGCELSKISFKNKDYDAKLIANDKTLDLALLKANIISSTYFSFSNEDAKKLNKIYVAGFPLGKGLSDDLKISSGIVSALKGFEDNSNEIQIDAPINPGNSGGPIINENGNLVAIAVSGLAKDQTEGINFGIKSSAAETFLKANNIKPKKSMYSRIKENDELLKILEEGTVYTYCD